MSVAVPGRQIEGLTADLPNQGRIMTRKSPYCRKATMQRFLPEKLLHLGGGPELPAEFWPTLGGAARIRISGDEAPFRDPPQSSCRELRSTDPI